MVTVRLRQSLTGSAGHLAAIADGQMDLALVSIQSSPSPLVALRELMREPMVFVCESSHPLADGARVRLVDLDGQDLIQFPVGWGIRQRVDAGLAAAGVNPVGAYEVADYAIAAELDPAPTGNGDPAHQRGKPVSRLTQNSCAPAVDVDIVDRLCRAPIHQSRGHRTR